MDPRSGTLELAGQPEQRGLIPMFTSEVHSNGKIVVVPAKGQRHGWLARAVENGCVGEELEHGFRQLVESSGCFQDAAGIHFGQQLHKCIFHRRQHIPNVQFSMPNRRFRQSRREQNIVPFKEQTDLPAKPSQGTHRESEL